MKRSTFFSILLVLPLSFTGCMKLDCDCDRDGDQKHIIIPPVLFQYEYYNYAWGFRHSGFLIDRDGQIRGFSQPERWITPDSSGFMAKEDLRYNLAKCDTISGTVNLDELDQYFSKIKDIRTGKIVDNGLVMADAGTGVFSAWYWNKKVGKFENVFLISNGDISKVNIHPEASELVAWLRWIGEKSGRFYWFGRNGE
jgi:hypothetical protein